MKRDMIVTETGNEMTYTRVAAKDNKVIIIIGIAKTITAKIIHHIMIAIAELIKSQTTDTDEIAAVQESVNEVEMTGVVAHLKTDHQPKKLKMMLKAPQLILLVKK